MASIQQPKETTGRGFGSGRGGKTDQSLKIARPNQ